MSFWKNLGKGDLTGAFHNLLDALTGHLPPELGTLVTRLMSDEGQVAYQVAMDAWNGWVDDHKPILDVAKDAVVDAISKGLSVAEKDVADWLGLMDRQ